MPTTYAHWRFGDRCIPTLGKRLQKIINDNRNIYNFGVHGPDIFFYYRCLKKNDINKFGSDLHDIPFGDTLKEIKPRYKEAKDKNMMLAYLLGFTAHFTLDSYCHGYIEIKEEKSGVSHGKLESQLDKYFLIKDGYDPIKKRVTFSLKPSHEIAKTIHEVFPNISEEECYGSIRDQLFYLNVLKDDSDIKRFILEKGMDLMGAKAFKELLMTKKEVPEVRDANERLNKYFDMAVKHYPILAKNMVNYLNDKEELLPYFRHHFCPKDDYRDIPVLSYEDELKYEVKDFQD